MSKILVRDVVSGRVNVIDMSAPVVRTGVDWRHRILRLSSGSESSPLVDVLPFVLRLLAIEDWLALHQCSKALKLAVLSQKDVWESSDLCRRWFSAGKVKLRTILPIAASRILLAYHAVAEAWQAVDVHLRATSVDFGPPITPDALLAIEDRFTSGFPLPASFRASLMLRNGQPLSTPPGRTLFGARLCSAEEMLTWRDAATIGTEAEPFGWEAVLDTYFVRRAACGSVSFDAAPGAAGTTGGAGARAEGVLIPISAEFGSRRLFVHAPSGVIVSVHGATVAVVAATFLHFLRQAVR